MSMIQDIVRQETKSVSAETLEGVPKPMPAPKKLGKFPAAFSLAGRGAKAGGTSGAVPKLADLTPLAPPPLSAKQFPGGESAALQRLREKVVEPSRQNFVREFAKPKTSSTNVEIDEDW